MKKIFKNKMLKAFALGLILIIPQVAKASGEFDSQKEAYMYGAGLNQNQIQEVKNKLGLSDDINKSSVNGDDCQKYLGYKAEDYNMISSVSVKKLPKGSGIKVEILTPENITSITQSQYTNAAITSGITDAEIKVASPTKVTGESALVGVYKAIEMYGEKVNTQSTQTAQEELGTLKKISEENENKESFDKDKLDQAVAEVKHKKFAGTLTEKGKKFYEDNKEDIDKVGNDIKESGLWDKIVQFFKDLFASFTNSNDDSSNN